MTITKNTSPTRVAGKSRLAVIGATSAATVATWAVLAPLAGIELKAEQGSSTTEVTGVAVFLAATVSALAGWGLLALLERRTVNARKIWTMLAVAACVLSLGSPLVSGIGIGAKLGLALLHLVVGAVVVLGLRRTALSATDRCD
ncbi:hypothetical protein BWI15_12745 [Kribbella sp. ALI-6-A]|uniref:DUF6069 family protein n=1 Tax=Kribbella sp. ALI-6-A TaxID=1933817 RepID=UPI00097C4A75|nr:DUF6069 family protein [Kribbella sp. ALI-6-A]ONI74569.1 hypothetical protein BWI15_12745 [Kribbella sp. ALI-6-A]